MNSAAPSELRSNVTGFFNGSSDCAYTFLGAHPVQQAGKSGWLFRVWAPNAKSVSIVGSFNNWTEGASQMHLLPGGIWERFLPGLQVYDSYQYSIETQAGTFLRKADPFAFHAETRPSTASKLYDLSGYSWQDQPWLDYRARRPAARRPLNIYELHLGSWRRTGDGRFLSYRELAKWLVPYVKEMGFTAVELLPVTEHLFDDSWGYLCTGYFAPTSRFGPPHDFMYLVDQLHQAGVAVLLDWVPAYFPQDAHGLIQFDGTPCFEYADPRKAEFPVRHTRAFDCGCSQVWSFLNSSALFWLREYHIDGLRMCGVSSMLYLDYDGRAWQPNSSGGRENLEAIAFLRQLNTRIHRQFPAALTVATDPTAWPHITDAPEADPFALGFTYQWNLGWMRNVLHYVQLDPIYRQYSHQDLTDSIPYAFSGQFILPIPHDEVSTQRDSLLGCMPGEDATKFAGVRAFYLYMLTHPGKKLLMMGTEFGQLGQWRHEYSLDWHLLEYQPYRQHQAFFRSANQFYLANPPLWELDDRPEGFQWICRDDACHNIIIYLRRDQAGGILLAAVNFSPMGRIGYRIGVPAPGIYQVAFHSDSTEFGGSGRVDCQPLHSTPIACHHFSDSLLVDLPPMTGLILRCVRTDARLVPPRTGKREVSSS